MTLLASLWTWDGWPAVVAIGTLALAATTALLAWMTRDAVREARDQIKVTSREVEAVERQGVAIEAQTEAVRAQADATERQVRTSAAALEASVRPVLVGVAPMPELSGHSEQIDFGLGALNPSIERTRVYYALLDADHMLLCSVPLKNVGAGVAFVQRVNLLVGNSSYDGRISQAVVPPNELTRVRFMLKLQDQAGRPTDVNDVTGRGGRGFAQFTIHVVYTGAARELVMASQVTVAQTPNGEFLIVGNDVYEGDSGDRTLLVSSQNVQ